MAETTANSGQVSQANEDTAGTQIGNVDADIPLTGETGGGSTAGDADNTPGGSEELPDWARKQLKKARDEAASYRVQLREAEEKFKGAKTDAELEATLKPLQELLDQSSKQNAELERQLIIRDHGLDSDLAEFVTGDNAEEWEKKAKALSERLGASNKEQRFGPQRTPAGRFGNEKRVEADAKETAKSVFNRHRD